MRARPPASRRLAASLLAVSFLALAPAAAADPLPPAALPPLPGRPPVITRRDPAAPVMPAVSDPRPAAGSGDLRKNSEALADVAERVSPSVVQIDVVTGGSGASPTRLSRADGGMHGLGSGVIFSADGAVLTSNHVIEDARAITVRLRDGRMFKASVAGRDPSTDLAVLRIEARGCARRPSPTATRRAWGRRCWPSGRRSGWATR